MNSATREQALRIAQRLGCYGAHQTDDGSWMPCPSHDALKSVLAGEVPKGVTSRKSAIASRMEKAASVSGKLFSSRDEALAESRRNGCSGVRVVKINGGTMFAACMPKNNGRPENTGMITPVKGSFEELGEGGIISIETLPSGGLVSGKSLDIGETEIDAKSFVNYVSRSTDPDVYTDPDSARKRARQLGCIGIRRYTASDGKTVWMPCTNGSDYMRASNITPSGYTRNRRGAKKSLEEFSTKAKKRKLAQTPAPKKDRIFGSGLNPRGSARSASSASEISMDSQTVNSLAEKVRKHNAEMSKRNKEKWSMTNLRALKAVYRRGAGAFSVSHRPGMTRNQWAMGRVNAFLKILSSGKPANSAYKGDNDLLPEKHPWKKRGIAGKAFTIGDNDYFAELHIEGVKTSKGLERKVARYIAINLGASSETGNQEISS